MTDLREVLKPVTEAEFLRRLDNYTTRVADTFNGFLAGNAEKREDARKRVIAAFMSLHARLEMNDEFPAHDGIACRDATIKLQDERIAKLQSESATATGGEVKGDAFVWTSPDGKGLSVHLRRQLAHGTELYAAPPPPAAPVCGTCGGTKVVVAPVCCGEMVYGGFDHPPECCGNYAEEEIPCPDCKPAAPIHYGADAMCPKCGNLPYICKPAAQSEREAFEKWYCAEQGMHARLDREPDGSYRMYGPSAAWWAWQAAWQARASLPEPPR
jgi:hypothetical protein